MEKNKKLRVILWDIETSRITAKTFGLYNQNINHRDIVEDWRILCIAWKELGKKGVQSVACTDEGEHTSDRNVVERVHKVICDADILIAHNGDKFDLKKFNSKVIEYQLPPLPPVLTIDTLKAYKQVAKATSHRLDFLGGKLIGEQKITNTPGLWGMCEEGDLTAMRKMVRYCKQDVNLLEKLYVHLRPYMKRHPNVAQFDEISCPRCGSLDLIKHKPRLTASGIQRQQYQCKDCGSYHTPRYGSIVNQTILK